MNNGVLFRYVYIYIIYRYMCVEWNGMEWNGINGINGGLIILERRPLVAKRCRSRSSSKHRHFRVLTTIQWWSRCLAVEDDAFFFFVNDVCWLHLICLIWVQLSVFEQNISVMLS
jgi:hypothetical protein